MTILYKAIGNLKSKSKKIFEQSCKSNCKNVYSDNQGQATKTKIFL